MLPSSSGLGRCPPQGGNVGSNPAGSAIPLCSCHSPFNCFGGSPTARCRTEGVTTTKCPKIGAAQWTCTYAECICHLKGTLLGPECGENEHN